LFGWIVFRERLGALALVGLVTGFGGVALIMGSRLSGGVDLYGVVLCGIGALALTFATLALRGASSGGNVMMIVGLQMLVGSVVLAVPAVTTETWDVTWSWQLIAAFAYTTLIPGLAATWVWFTLVNRIGAVRAATFHFLNPFFGVLVAAALLDEAMGAIDWIGVAIIAAAILVVQLSRQGVR
jgi:drug/metabolite transporter (DMT)-like permease